MWTIPSQSLDVGYLTRVVLNWGKLGKHVQKLAVQAVLTSKCEKKWDHCRISTEKLQVLMINVEGYVQLVSYKENAMVH